MCDWARRVGISHGKCPTDATSFYRYFSYQYCYYPLCPPQHHGNCIPLLVQSALPLSSESLPLSHQALAPGCKPITMLSSSSQVTEKILMCTTELGCSLARLPQGKLQPAFPDAGCSGRKRHDSMDSLESVALESTLTTIPSGSLGNPLPPQPPNGGKFNS